MRGTMSSSNPDSNWDAGIIDFIELNSLTTIPISNSELNKKSTSKGALSCKNLNNNQ